MVTTRTIRGVGRRMLLTFLASAGVAGVAALPATAQTGGYMPSVSGPASGFELNDVPLAPGEVIVNASSGIGGAIHHNGGSYQIIDSSSVPMATGTMMDPAMTSMMSPQSFGGYPNTYAGGCATGNCGGGYAAGIGGAACGIPCNPYLYAALEGLYIKNTRVDNFSASPNFRLNDFDYEFGVRGTVGIVPDCRNGMEVSFTGPIDWRTQTNTPTLPGGGLGTFLAPRPSLDALDFSTFNNAIFQSQRYEADYFSIEANRTLIGWEICKFLYGVRYVNYDEDYFYRSVVAGGDQGLLRSSTENKMIGAQIGIDMTYPMTCKMWSDVRARAGAYANFAENIFELNNAAAAVVRNFDDDVELAGLFEIGSGVRYYVTDDFHVRAGTELWYIAGVASATDQFRSRIGQGTGRDIRMDDDVLMIGLSVGAELKF